MPIELYKFYKIFYRGLIDGGDTRVSGIEKKTFEEFLIIMLEMWSEVLIKVEEENNTKR
jgi:hypothetical protein